MKMGFCGSSSVARLLTTLVLLLLANVHFSESHLSPTFYDKSCPDALSTIRTAIRRAVSRERRMAASLIRLHFHDCFVQGCDASLLLDPTSDFPSERDARQNFRSVRGFEVIEAAKREVEKICPGVVSCADVLAVAARDASAAVGGPSWRVKLGRRDSATAASQDVALADLPSFTDSLEDLINTFGRKGLSARDMVALSGAHTIGQAQCATFRERIYSSTNIDAGFASTRRRRCPPTGGNDKLAALDLVTPNSFDNNYFKNLIQKKGLLESDQVLFNGGSTDSIVRDYSKHPKTFSADFAAAMVRMGDITPLTGSAGQIRKVCSAVN